MSTLTFKRLVLGMHHDSPDDEALRTVADLAELMHMQLLGLYAQDPALIGVAALPFVREFRLLGGGWRPLDVGQLDREVELTAQRLEYRFSRTVRDRSIESSFRVIKGAAAHVITTISEAGDIVVVTEPASPLDRATDQSALLAEAAFRSRAAVLLVPHRIARRRGPIVAIATEPDDPTVAAAVGIAAATGERVVLLQSDHGTGEQGVLADVSLAGVEIDRLPPKFRRPTDAVGICQALNHTAERLVVMRRGAFDDSVPAMVASLRHIPVLVVEPATLQQRGDRSAD